MAGLAALLLVGGGVALASGDSLPGDVLYPVKRGIEDVRLALTPSDAGKASRHIALAENRAEELAMVAPNAGPERIADLSQEINHNLGEAQRLAASLTDGEKVAEIRDRLERSAHTHLALLEGSLGDVSEGSRAAFNDAFQLSSQGYAQAVETVALRAPAPLLTSLGFLQLRASDPPAPPLDNVFVEVDKIEAYLAAGSESKWITIVDSPNAFDLLRVEQIHKFLGQQEIPAGTYTQIRFEIGQAVVVAQGEAHIAKVPSGKLSFGRPFTVVEGQTTIVTIDFDGQRSVQLNGEGDYMLVPEVKLLVNEPLYDGEESSTHHHQAFGEKIEIEGVIESFSTTTDSNTQLVVGGLILVVTPETEVDGILSEGVYVEAEVVEEPDGSYTVVELEVKDEERRARLPKVENEGTIDAINGDTWTVAGHIVHLTGEATWDVGGQTVTVATNAEIDGDPQVGYTVEVEGLLAPDGTLLALEIEVDDEGERELTGVIEGLYRGLVDIGSLSAADVEAAEWDGPVTVELADGTSFIIGEDTEIDGLLQNGVEVEVEVTMDANGNLYATEIEVEDDSDREEHAHMELSGVISGLYGAQGDISSLSEEDLEGQDWPGDVTVTLADGTSFIIGEDTEIDGLLQNGVEVEVEIETAADGTRYATEIELVDDDEEEEAVASETREDRAEPEDSEDIAEPERDENDRPEGSPSADEEADRLSGLVDNLLDMTRIEAGSLF